MRERSAGESPQLPDPRELPIQRLVQHHDLNVRVVSPPGEDPESPLARRTFIGGRIWIAATIIHELTHFVSNSLTNHEEAEAVVRACNLPSVVPSD